VPDLFPLIWFVLAAGIVLLAGLKLLLGRGGPRDEQGRKQFRLRPVRRLFGGLLAALACVSGLLAASVAQFYRLTADRPVAEVKMARQAEQTFLVSVLPQGGAPLEYTLAGDQWQIDARVVRWRLPALLAGVPPLYRLERLSGRYGDAQRERTAPRTVHDLARWPVPDLGTLKRAYPDGLPFVDVQFGSAAYMPMFDGAHYDVLIDPRGALFIRPADPATEAELKQQGW